MRNILDTTSMNISGGILTADSTTVAAMDAASFQLPGGNTYMAEVGHLPLGR